MADLLLVVPLAVPLACAALGVLLRRARRAQVVLALAGPLAVLAAGAALVVIARREGIQVVEVGAWPAPFAITLVCDLLAALMVVVTGAVGAATALYSLGSIDEERRAYGYFPLFNVLLMGVSGAFLTGDIFNLYVWFEVMLIASFVLLALGGRQAQLEGAIKYVTLNLVSSSLFLAAAGALYGLTGALNLAHLAQVLSGASAPSIATFVSMLFLVAFGIKAAAFPLFFWLPASYHTPPIAVSAVFAGLLTKVGVYALLRTFTLLFVHDVERTHEVIVWMACATMLAGVLGALAQTEVRRILAFHIVSQIGYMLLGLGIFTREAVAASIFYVVHHILVKTNLFLVAGLIGRLSGSLRLARIGGLQDQAPWLAALFLLPALSLAGVPPLSGFLAKLALLRASLEAERFVPAAVALLVGLFTLMSMTKIWSQAFWQPPPGDARPPACPIGAQDALRWAPVVLLTLSSLAVAAFAGPLYELCLDAVAQTMDRDVYVRAVLGVDVEGLP